jgi:hypothetical protein
MVEMRADMILLVCSKEAGCYQIAKEVSESQPFERQGWTVMSQVRQVA